MVSDIFPILLTHPSCFFKNFGKKIQKKGSLATRLGVFFKKTIPYVEKTLATLRTHPNFAPFAISSTHPARRNPTCPPFAC